MWRVSGYDDQVHAFVVSAADVTMVSAARPCYHSVPTDKVTDDVGDARRCPACLITVAVATQEQVDASVTATLEGSPEGLRTLPVWRDRFGSASSARPRD
ncbi:hypothetical protein [Actinophytocola sediminis]